MEPQGSHTMATNLPDGFDVYWRLDDAGCELSASWRSADINDPDYQEEGTSSYGSLSDLLEEGGYARGHVTIVAFHAELLATGLDGEPVVRPTVEAARWEHPDWDGFRHDELEADEIDTEELLQSLGWQRVATTPVAD